MSELKIIDGSIYDESTREWLGNVLLKAEPDGCYPLPDNVVAHAPSETAPAFHTYVLNSAGDAWDLCVDYRRILMWDTTTAMPVPNAMKLGQPLPDTLTSCPPPVIPPGERKRPVWDSSQQAWTLEDLSPVEQPDIPLSEDNAPKD